MSGLGDGPKLKNPEDELVMGHIILNDSKKVQGGSGRVPGGAGRGPSRFHERPASSLCVRNSPGSGQRNQGGMSK